MKRRGIPLFWVFLRTDQTNVCQTWFQCICFCLRVGTDLMKPLPFLHIYHFFLYPNENSLSVLSYLSFKSTVFATQTSETFEFYYIAAVRMLVYFAQNISGTQKQYLLLLQIIHKSGQIIEWKYRKRSKWGKNNEGLKEKKWLKTKLQKRKKNISLKKIIFFLCEKTKLQFAGIISKIGNNLRSRSKHK